MATDKKHYTLQQQLDALKTLDENGDNYMATSVATGVNVQKLHQWRRKADELQAAWRRQQQAKAALLMAEAQVSIAEKTQLMLKALDETRIANAPLNQVAAALGVLVDRYVKLTDDAPQTAEQVIRFEYIHPDGQAHASPPWADDDSEGERPLQGRGVRASLRENGASEAHAVGNGAARRRSNVVARPDIRDGAAGVAGLESDDAEHLWYDD